SHYYDPSLLYFFSFTHTPPTKIYTLSLHDALPILDQGNASATAGVQKDDTIFDQYFCNGSGGAATGGQSYTAQPCAPVPSSAVSDRKSTRLNSSHLVISYAVFCLKKKKKHNHDVTI